MNKFLRLVKRIVNRSSIIIKDCYIDLSIQKRLIGNKRINSVDPGSGISNWQSTSYDAIEKIFFDNLRTAIVEDDIIVDVGSGDGKVFNFLLHRKLKNKMIGYEINLEHCKKTKKALNKYPNVEIICGDMFNHFPSNATLFYLFNPFDARLMKRFVGHLLKMKDIKPVVIYNRPIFISLFDSSIFDVEMIHIHQYKFDDGKYAVIRFKN